jgi:hypothetical protein
MRDWRTRGNPLPRGIILCEAGETFRAVYLPASCYTLQHTLRHARFAEWHGSGDGHGWPRRRFRLLDIVAKGQMSSRFQVQIVGSTLTEKPGVLRLLAPNVGSICWVGNRRGCWCPLIFGWP